MTTLLDANLLIALAFAEHMHHERAEFWFSQLDDTHATCPITQGALVRHAMRLGDSAPLALRFVRAITALPRHEFWEDDVGFHQIDLRGVVGHRQVTDAYLAGLARHRGGRLATLDRGLAALHPDVTLLAAADS
jgi:toxin-antitoxin system PIN domain toxin